MLRPYSMSEITERVAHRYRAGFKYVPKEKKKAKVVRLTKVVRDATGLSRGVAESIVDAIVRGREVERLALQKNWPVEDGDIVGPKGTISITDVQSG